MVTQYSTLTRRKSPSPLVLVMVIRKHLAKRHRYLHTSNRNPGTFITIHILITRITDSSLTVNIVILGFVPEGVCN